MNATRPKKGFDLLMTTTTTTPTGNDDIILIRYKTRRRLTLPRTPSDRVTRMEDRTTVQQQQQHKSARTRLCQDAIGARRHRRGRETATANSANTRGARANTRRCAPTDATPAGRRRPPPVYDRISTRPKPPLKTALLLTSPLARHG